MLQDPACFCIQFLSHRIAKIQIHSGNSLETATGFWYSELLHLLLTEHFLSECNTLVFQYYLMSIVCLFVPMGVRGKPRMYCSLLAYCTARFGRSNFGNQMPPRLPKRSAL
jgi:hypothetical protein